jgi:hypothetical protein
MASNFASAPIRVRTPVRKTIGTSAVQGPDSGVHHAFILKAICPSQVIYVGDSAAVTTATGYPMTDNETLVVEGRNSYELYFIASAAAQAISVLPFDRV